MTDWLVGTCAATSLLAALVLVVREPVRRGFGPSVAYSLWLLPATRAVLPSFTTTVERVVAPASAPGIAVPGLTSAAAAMPPSPEGWIVDWPALLIALWLAGAAAMLVRGLLVHHSQRRTMLEAAVEYGSIGGVRIVGSASALGPAAFGLIDRVIVVPLDFDCRFSERQRSLALAHELAHHRSGDLWANLIAFVLLCLQWFNPLAWAAHSAFRFDQEAACDARVLDKADARDRRLYGEAIAKAATRRSLLFAGALDQPSTLSRRLKIMTQATRSQRRRAGLLLIGGALLLALPLTATSAVNYVDIASPSATARVVPELVIAGAPAPVRFEARIDPELVIDSGSAPALNTTKLAALAPVAAAQPRPHSGRTFGRSDLSIDKDSVWIDGKRKRWEDLTPEERARVRAATAEARKDIDKQIANLPRQMAELERTRDMFRSGDFQRQMVDAREGVQRALAEMDSQANILRATGQEPEKMKRDLRKTLDRLNQANVDKLTRDALESADPDKVRNDIMNAKTELDRVEARLNQIEHQ
jgi:bla regulator protein BlaR1